MDKYFTKVGLGSAQWGLNYGVSNKFGQTPAEEVRKILQFSISRGIRLIDTAPCYGNSETVIGANNNYALSLCTKLPALKHLPLNHNLEDFFQSSLSNSLDHLRTDSVEYLLLHDCDDLSGSFRTRVASVMQQYKDCGVAKKIGFSAYTSDQISSALEFFVPDVVQIPFNIFDQRLLFDGTLSRLKNLGVEIHARSIFLQGLLLMAPSSLDAYFAPFMPSICHWHSICSDLKVQPLDLALYFVLSHLYIDKAIIGISNLSQLEQIVSSIDHESPSFSSLNFSELGQTSVELLNPAFWNLKL